MLMCADALAPTVTTIETTPSAHKLPYFFQDFLNHKNVVTIMTVLLEITISRAISYEKNPKEITNQITP